MHLQMQIICIWTFSLAYRVYLDAHLNVYESELFTDQSSHQPAPPQCAPSGEPTRCCTWSRSGWRVLPCSTDLLVCSWRCRPPLVPSKTQAAALGGLTGRFLAARWAQRSRRPLWRETVTEETDERKYNGKEKLKAPERKRKRERMDCNRKRSSEGTEGQCIITTVFAWDYPFTQHTVKSLSFDILECLHKCILEHGKFWDSSQAVRLCGFTETGPSLV